MSSTPSSTSSSTRAAPMTFTVPAVFLIIAFALFLLSAIGLRFAALSLSDFGLACFAFAFLYDILRK